MQLIASAAAAMLTVWVLYHPADSTALEQGQALGFTVAVMIFVGVGAWVYRIGDSLDARDGRWREASFWVDAAPLLLAGWVLLSAWVTAGVFSGWNPGVGGDLRAASNEAWWWIAASGWFVLARRLVFGREQASAIIGLLLACGVLLAVHTLHQYFISFPQTMQDYLRDPDRMLSEVGIDAPEGSAARMIFENRLRDGGPTATFALANSLAGPLAMLVVAGGGFLIDWVVQWRRGDTEAPSSHRGMMVVMLAAIVTLLMSALLVTSSRSGLLSVVIVAAAWSARTLLGNSFATGDRLVSHRILAAMGVLAFSALGLALWYRKSLLTGEWISQAPATLSLRLQYWWSTLAMISEHVWFGAGPGNFQLVYQQYRDLRAHELIAEPHNFLFETLASGGVVAGILLIGWVLASFLYSRKIRVTTTPSDSPVAASPPSGQRVGIVVGAAAWGGVMLVWYAAIASGNVPDFDANLLALPLCVVAYVGWWFATKESPTREPGTATSMGQCRGVARAATATGLIHLCFSGGWTVPGVSVFLIWFASIATSVPVTPPESGTAKEKTLGVSRSSIVGPALVGTLWAILILVAIVFSWLPVRQTRAAVANASVLMRTNRVAVAKVVLRSALASDPLASDAAIWLATVENQSLMQAFVAASSSPPAVSPAIVSRQRKVTDAAFSEAIDRSGNAPDRLRAIGEQFVQRYQVAGELSDLEKANELFSIARKLSPTHESITAQQAEVVRELQRRGAAPAGATAEQLATRAETLASAGDVVTRQLSLQPILRARVVGRAALESPERMNADQILKTPVHDLP